MWGIRLELQGKKLSATTTPPKNRRSIDDPDPRGAESVGF
jgi:hypothetical protein